MDFLTNLDSETLKAELLAFLELGDDEFDISSMGEFEEQFVEFIKDDLSYAARMEDLKHMICMTPTEKKIVLK